jgi:ABC-type Mn2+/Zn2+ transport system permease subunit
MMFHKVFYYAVIFVPMGLLSAIAVETIKQGPVIRASLLLGTVFLPAFALECLLASVSGRVLRLDHLLLSTALAAFPIALLFFLSAIRHRVVR